MRTRNWCRRWEPGCAGHTFLPAAKGGPEEGWDGKEEGPHRLARPEVPTLSARREHARESFSPSRSRGAGGDDRGGQEVPGSGTGQVKGVYCTPEGPGRERRGRGFARGEHKASTWWVCSWQERAHRLPKPQAPGPRRLLFRGMEVWGFGGAAASSVSTEPQQWHRVPMEGAWGSPRSDLGHWPGS